MFTKVRCLGIEPFHKDDFWGCFFYIDKGEHSRRNDFSLFLCIRKLLHAYSASCSYVLYGDSGLKLCLAFFPTCVGRYFICPLQTKWNAHAFLLQSCMWPVEDPANGNLLKWQSARSWLSLVDNVAALVSLFEWFHQSKCWTYHFILHKAHSRSHFFNGHYYYMCFFSNHC